jgi:hypothetical protein
MMPVSLGWPAIFASAWAIIAFSTPVLAVETVRERLTAPQQTDIKNQGTVRTPETAPRAARVRILVKFTEYDKLLIKNDQGTVRTEYRAVRTRQHTLRARIERNNHFYVGDWHIETTPIAFAKETMKYSVSLHFSKKYGVGWDMEEYVGRTAVNGTLAGKDFLYDLIGANSAKFFNSQGNPLLDVEIGINPLTTPMVKGADENSKGTVAKSDTKTEGPATVK